MEVNSYKLAKVFSNSGEIHYVLPHFQRAYAWTKDNWKTLWNDALQIYDVYDDNNEPEHFLGALVVIGDGNRSGTIPAYKLVDGQQRLTTLSLFLCALRDLIRDSEPSLHRKISRLLINDDETGILRLKLVPTAKNGDREAYSAILLGENSARDGSGIKQCYDYAKERISAKIRQDDVNTERLYKVFVNCMHVVFINLNQRERPYEIFESLNAKGRPLTQSDLVRNYIAMRLPEAKQELIFEKHWTEIENLLSEDRTVSRIPELTAFFRHYLAHISGILYNKDHVYARFRDRMEKDFSSSDSFEGEIKTIHRYAIYYNNLLRPANESDPDIRAALDRLNTLESATAYPFLLAMYEWFRQNLISRQVFIDILKVIEGYMVRRYLAVSPSGYTNKMFPTLEREIDRSQSVESLKQALLRKNYPSDSRVRQGLTTFSIYDSRSLERLVLVLETINQRLSHGSGGFTVLDNDATIEHILPQTPSEAWHRDLERV